LCNPTKKLPFFVGKGQFSTGFPGIFLRKMLKSVPAALRQRSRKIGQNNTVGRFLLKNIATCIFVKMTRFFYYGSSDFLPPDIRAAR